MTTIKDVAQAANVSTASVSRVLAGHPSASEEMRQRVLDVVRELRFRPNAVARSLRTTGTRTVGLVVSDLLNPFFTELARAVENTARQAGYSVIVGNADENPDQQDHYVRILLERQVEGLIVVPTIETSPLLREAADRGHHLVLVDRPAEDVHAPIVMADGAAAIDDLVDHLVHTGRRDLAIVTGPDQAGTSRERLASFRAALARHGLALPEERIWHGNFRADSGHDALADLINSAVVPDAVLVANGVMALGALQFLADRRGPTVNIPDDLALAVFDDMPWFPLLRPTLTAIEQPTRRLGMRAVQMLLALIAGEEVADERMACRLILRESTAPATEADTPGAGDAIGLVGVERRDQLVNGADLLLDGAKIDAATGTDRVIASEGRLGQPTHVGKAHALTDPQRAQIGDTHEAALGSMSRCLGREELETAPFDETHTPVELAPNDAQDAAASTPLSRTIK